MEESNKDFFNRWAETYSTHLPFFPEFQKLVKRISEEVVCNVKETESHVLDVGIGTGVIPTLIHQKNPNINFWGVDFSESMLQKVPKNPFQNIKLYACDLDEMPFNESQFEIVYSNFTLHHKEDKIKTLSKIYKFLKPNGIFILGEVVVDVPHYSPKFLAHVLERWGYTALHALKYSGQDAVKIELEVMRKIYARDGEFLETHEEWKKCLDKSGFKLLKHEIIDEKLGYHIFVCDK